MREFKFWKTDKRLKTIQRILPKILLDEKAKTLLRDDIFSFQFEDHIFKFHLPYATRDLVQRAIFDSLHDR